MRRFVQVPPKTFCAECHLIVAPYAEHVCYRGKIWHGECWMKFFAREREKNKEKVKALKKAFAIRRAE